MIICSLGDAVHNYISTAAAKLLFRLDCDNIRRGLGDGARRLSNLLLQNVVDTYRKENEQ
jgi:hypothetical protein